MQRKFFEDLSLIDELVITTKNKELCSMNVHGSFELFDIHWHGAEYPQDETMIALKENNQTRISIEPSVHFHIDWTEVKYVSLRQRYLELIKVDYEIVFCRERDINSRIFWFYIKEESTFYWLTARWGRNWINLSEGSLVNPHEPEFDQAKFFSS